MLLNLLLRYQIMSTTCAHEELDLLAENDWLYHTSEDSLVDDLLAVHRVEVPLHHLIFIIWKRSSYIADDESECSSIDSDVDSDCSTDDEALGAVSPTKSRSRRQVTFAMDVKFQPTKPRKSYKRKGTRSGQG